MKKLAFIGAISLLCSGCASTQQYDAAYQRCKEQYPAYPELEPETAVASVKCFSRIPLPPTSNGDLINRVNATRLVVAEKLEKGQISPAEAKQQIAEEVSRAVSEMESRRTANRVAAAMETAATPRTCYRFSNGAATCF